jgi:thiazole synthase
MKGSALTIAGRTFSSRLFIGTGKFPSLEVTRRAIVASGASMVTVAIRRIDLSEKGSGSVLDVIEKADVRILPNTAGCSTAEEAIRTARLAREAGLSEFIKLEVIGDQKTLFPDNQGLLEATKVLVKEGFVVLPYTNDDLVVAKRLRDAGAAAIMPLAAPIGSGLGIQNPVNLRLLLEEIQDLPVIVDAGVGTASDATVVMELGADGVLMNTGIAGASDPEKMARAMRLAVESGRLAFEAGRMAKRLFATASSPVEGIVRSGA